MDDFLAIIKGYQDILVKIEQHTVLKESAEKDRAYYLKQMNTGAPHEISGMNMDGQPKGNFSPISLDRAVEAVNRCDNMIHLEQCEIDRLTKEKKAIEKSIDKLEGLEHRVAFKRIFEKNKDGSFKTLQQIADELGYSLPTIWRASANVSKKVRIKEIREEM